MIKKKLNGVYLVIDPSVKKSILLEKVQAALEGGVAILQIWNNWSEETGGEEKESLIHEILAMARDFEVPVLINDDWELLNSTRLHGVHFDEMPGDFRRIKEEINRDFIAGITCENDLNVVRWADKNGFDYISFCAMFPSPSVGSCEIVSPETVRRARELTDLPLFLSGGITPEKVGELDHLDFSGVAVISGILNADSPDQKTLEYQTALSNS